MVFLLAFWGCQAESETSPSKITEQEDAESVFYERQGYVLQVLGGQGIEEVEVCQYPTGECVTTDEDGAYQLSLESVAEPQIQYQHPDYVMGFIALPTLSSEQDIPNISLIPPEIMTAQMDAVELSWTANTGLVAFSISNGIFGDGINVEGVQVDIEPANGNGPFYTNALGLPTDNLVETSANGGGVWLNLPPQTYDVTHEGIPEDCRTLLGWEGPEALRVPVLAGAVSYVRIECLDNS